jgi:hypothetical protein
MSIVILSTGGEGKDFNGGGRRTGKRKGSILINNVMFLMLIQGNESINEVSGISNNRKELRTVKRFVCKYSIRKVKRVKFNSNVNNTNSLNCTRNYQIILNWTRFKAKG